MLISAFRCGPNQKLWPVLLSLSPYNTCKWCFGMLHQLVLHLLLAVSCWLSIGIWGFFVFYRFYFRRYALSLIKFASLCFSSDDFYDFPVLISRFYKDIYANNFLLFAGIIVCKILSFYIESILFLLRGSFCPYVLFNQVLWLFFITNFL